MRLSLFLLILASSLSSMAQNPRAKSVEEILKKKNPNEFLARENKERYLVLDKGNGKRKKYHNGDLIAFKTKDDLFFQNEITQVGDRFFSIVYFDKTTNRYENRTIGIEEVAFVLKRPRRDSKIKPAYILLASVPWLLVEWGLFGEKPWENYSTLGTMAVIQSGSILLLSKDKFFNRMKVKENKWQLKVFQY